MPTDTTAEVSTDVNASPHRVWEALTDPDQVSQYFMGATVVTDWKIGHPITFSGEWKGQAFEDKGEVLTFEPEHELSFSYWSPLAGNDDVSSNYLVVRFTLAGLDDGTHVTLTQSNLEGGVSEADRARREDYEKNWTSTLDGLKEIAES